jgi:hypothetical protein
MLFVRRGRLNSFFLTLLFALNSKSMLFAQTISPDSRENAALKEKPQYTLNAFASGGAGLLGLGIGILGGAVATFPFCLSGNPDNKTCTAAAISLTYIGGSLGMGLMIDSVSKKFGLKHSTFWAIFGSFVGNIPFAYFFGNYRIDTTGPNSDLYAKWALLCVPIALVVDLIFVHINSMRNEEQDIKLTLNMRSYFSETIFQPAITKRF